MYIKCDVQILTYHTKTKVNKLKDVKPQIANVLKFKNLLNNFINFIHEFRL